MAINETLVSISNLTDIAPNLITGGIFSIFDILKTVGIFFIAYAVIMIVQTILRIKDRNRLKRIEGKLDILLKKKKK